MRKNTRPYNGMARQKSQSRERNSLRQTIRMSTRESMRPSQGINKADINLPYNEEDEEAGIKEEASYLERSSKGDGFSSNEPLGEVEQRGTITSASHL